MDDEEDLDDYTKMWDEAKNEYWLERDFLDLEDDDDLDPWDECNEEEDDE